MSIITNTVAAGMGIVTAIGVVFHEEIIPPLPVPVIQVYCDVIQVFDEFTTPIVSGCRYEGYPVIVRLPALNPVGSFPQASRSR